MSKPLTPNLTSYDFLKCAALLLMIVDHVGHYFYPEEDWLRAIGRLSAPIWLFLIGYAQSRDFSTRMWIAIALLEIGSFVTGTPVLPLPILATMLVLRACIDPVMNHLRQSPQSIYALSAIAFILTIPTAAVLEYGSEVFLMVMLGYMIRNRQTLPYSDSQITVFAVIACLSHIAYQTMVFFTFNQIQTMFVAGGIFAVVFFILMQFRPYEYPSLTAGMPRPFVWLIQLGGRRTLEFYVLHILLFKAILLWQGADGYGLFNLRILE